MKTIAMMVLVLVCSGCQHWQVVCNEYLNQQPAEVVTPQPAETVTEQQYWLRITDMYIELLPDQAQQQLEEIDDQDTTSLQWFRRGLLNQQLAERAGWIRARDAFRQVLLSPDLSQDLRGLVTLLLRHNQNMINWQEKHSKVTLQLQESEGMQRVMEEKIQAITNLEQNMSSRKEQVQDAELADEAVQSEK